MQEETTFYVGRNQDEKVSNLTAPKWDLKVKSAIVKHNEALMRTIQIDLRKAPFPSSYHETLMSFHVFPMFDKIIWAELSTETTKTIIINLRRRKKEAKGKN